jgi:multidrug efflux pump subunit AcrA (membrane-fusion protein)
MIKKIIIFSFLAWFYTGCTSDKKDITPTFQDIQEWVFAPGQIDWDDKYNLSSQSEGILLNADYEIGSQLTKGSIVASVDNKTSQVNTTTAKDQLIITQKNLTLSAPAIAQLKQNIQIAKKKYDFSNSLSNRYEELFKNNSVTKVELESKVLETESALLNLNALQSQYDLLLQQAKQQNIVAKGQFNNSKIQESFNNIVAFNGGTVVKKMKSSGDYVRKGDIIALIANPDKIEIFLTLDETNVGKIKIGQKAVIKLNIAKDQIFNGKVNEVQSSFDEMTQSFICKVILDGPLPKELNIYGTPLECNILVGEKKKALLIPREYLGFGNKVKVKDQKESVQVKTGIISTDYVEVLEGIDEHTILLPIRQ